MTILSSLKNTVLTVGGSSGPRLITVEKGRRLTPNMIRVVFACPEGGNCKLFLPELNETRQSFAKRLIEGPNR